jgi:hypothetical protein
MKDSTEVLLESGLISAFNVVAVYIAAFTYHMNWSGVLGVIVFASIITAGLTHFMTAKIMATRNNPDMMLGEAIGALVIAIIGSLAVFIILIDRFDLPSALGISLLSGLLTSFIRHLLS